MLKKSTIKSFPAAKTRGIADCASKAKLITCSLAFKLLSILFNDNALTKLRFSDSIINKKIFFILFAISVIFYF